FGLRYGVDLGATAVADLPAGRGYTLMSEAFAPGALSPVTVVVAAPGGALDDAQLQAISRYTAGVTNQPEAAEAMSITSILDGQLGGHTAENLRRATASRDASLAGLVSSDGSTTIVTVVPRHASDSAEAAALVAGLRTEARQILAGGCCYSW